MLRLTDAGSTPRCRHGRIIFGCPRDDCPEQLAALKDRDAAVAAYYRWQHAEARRLVRQELGLGS